MKAPTPTNKYLYYKNLSTNDLEAIIHLDYYDDSQHLDYEDLYAILQILEDRKTSLQTNFNPQKSWLSFCENYFCFVKQSTCLYDENCKNKILFRYKKRLLLIIIILIFFIVSISAFIYTKTINDPNWLSAINYIRSTENLMNKNTIQQQYSFPTLPDHIVPNYIPKNLELIEEDFTENLSFQRLKLCYKNSKTGEFLNYRLFYLSNESVPQFEKDEKFIEIYSKDNIDFYIMKNIDNIVVLWRVDNFECQLSGTIDYEDFIKIINSI